MPVLDEYRAALKRLIDGDPLIVRTGSKITNDSVALEAGRSRGAIKKSRVEFTDLISEIKHAASERDNSAPVIQLANSQLKDARNELSRLKEEHLTLLAKYLSILHYNYQLQVENKRLGGGESVLVECVQIGIEI